jgi:hypothetical protein
VVVANHVGHAQIFEIDGVVGSEQGERRLLVKVSALPSNLLMLPLEQCHGLLPALAPLLPTCDPSLRLLERLFSLQEETWVLHLLPIRRDEELLQADVDARLLAGRWQRFYRHLGTGETGIPAVSFPRDDDCLGCAFKRTMHPEGDAANLGETEHPTV